MKKSGKSISGIRIRKQKAEFLEQLKKTPVIQVVCEKLNIGRSTLYRWRDEDEEFSEAIDEAIEDGRWVVNDLAESKIINSINKGDINSAKFWVKTHHPAYSPKHKEEKQKEKRMGLYDILKREMNKITTRKK